MKEVTDYYVTSVSLFVDGVVLYDLHAACMISALLKNNGNNALEWSGVAMPARIWQLAITKLLWEKIS
jgi:hypothetical protein